jgi:hypothetical protein
VGHTTTTRAGASIPIGLSSTACTMLNMAVHAPMAIASVAIATAADHGSQPRRLNA